MSEESEDSPLTDLALHIGKLLKRPGRMSVIRRMAESCLAEYRKTLNPIVQQIAGSYKEVRIEPYADLTAKQTALVVAVLHDACCYNIEKAIDVEKVMAGMMPDVGTLPDDPLVQQPVFVRECGRSWSMLLNQVQKLPETSAPWFRMQVRKFESDVRKFENKEKPRQRRRHVERRKKPLTPMQAEVVQLYGELKGNFTAVANRLGIKRQTAQTHYNRAMTKLGKSALPKPKTKALPKDRRGQETVVDPNAVDPKK